MATEDGDDEAAGETGVERAAYSAVVGGEVARSVGGGESGAASGVDTVLLTGVGLRGVSPVPLGMGQAARLRVSAVHR